MHENSDVGETEFKCVFLDLHAINIYNVLFSCNFTLTYTWLYVFFLFFSPGGRGDRFVGQFYITQSTETEFGG